VMDADAFLEERQQSLHLRQSAIVIRQSLDGIHEDLLDEHLLVVGVEVKSEKGGGERSGRRAR
jgi:hypothetical protein